MQNVSLLLSQARACGHGDTFSSARRPRAREEFRSPFSELSPTLTLMGVIGQLGKMTWWRDLGRVLSRVLFCWLANYS